MSDEILVVTSPAGDCHSSSDEDSNQTADGLQTESDEAGRHAGEDNSGIHVNHPDRGHGNPGKQTTHFNPKQTDITDRTAVQEEEQASGSQCSKEEDTTEVANICNINTHSITRQEAMASACQNANDDAGNFSQNSEKQMLVITGHANSTSVHEIHNDAEDKTVSCRTGRHLITQEAYMSLVPEGANMSTSGSVLEVYYSPGSNSLPTLQYDSDERYPEMNLEIHDVRTETVAMVTDETGEENIPAPSVKAEPVEEQPLFSAEVTVFLDPSSSEVETEDEPCRLEKNTATSTTFNCTSVAPDDLPELKVTLLDISTVPEIRKLWNIPEHGGSHSNEPSVVSRMGTGFDNAASSDFGTNIDKTRNLNPKKQKTFQKSSACKQKVVKKRPGLKPKLQKATVKNKSKGKPSLSPAQTQFSVPNVSQKKRGRPTTKKLMVEEKKDTENKKTKSLAARTERSATKKTIEAKKATSYIVKAVDDYNSDEDENIEDSGDEYIPSEYTQKRKDKLKAIFSKIKPSKENENGLKGSSSMERYYGKKTKPVFCRKGKKRIGRPPVLGEFCCKLCDFVANEKNLIVKHHAKVHMLQWIQCRHCDFTSRSRNVMLEHEARQHTNEKPFKCSYEDCDYASKCKNDLDRHKAKHATEKTHKCPHCDFTTKWIRNIRHHLLRHTSRRPYSCEICGFSFKRIQDLKYHLFRHNDEKPIKCDQCDFRCKTNFEIKCHKLKHSDVRYFKCTFPGCTQATKTKSDLNKHLKTHKSKRDEKCPICNKGFKTKAAAQKHKNRVHTTEKPFECHICNKKFKVKPALRNHIRLHEGIKPFKCEVCGRDFANKSNMQMHMETHDYENRPYHCPICPYGAKSIPNLLTHIGSMHGDSYAYFCELCKKPFKRYGQLQIHYKRMHSKSELAKLEGENGVDLALLKMEMKLDLESVSANEPKRKRGRPRKHPLPESEIVIKTEPIDLDDNCVSTTLSDQEAIGSQCMSRTQSDDLNTSDINPNEDGMVSSQRQGKESQTSVLNALNNQSFSELEQSDQSTLCNIESVESLKESAGHSPSYQVDVNQPDSVETVVVSDTSQDSCDDLEGSESQNASPKPGTSKILHGKVTTQLKNDDDADTQKIDQDIAAKQQRASATLVTYDGFRLPLATKGFQFNFEKTGKKPNSWFMSPQNMYGKAAQKQEAYLRKKGLTPLQIKKKTAYLSQRKVRTVKILSKTQMSNFLKKRRKKLRLPARKSSSLCNKTSMTEAMVNLAEDYKVQQDSKAKKKATCKKEKAEKVEFETLDGQKLSQIQVRKRLPVTSAKESSEAVNKKNSPSNPELKKISPKINEVSAKGSKAVMKNKSFCSSVEQNSVTDVESIKPKRKYVRKQKIPLLSTEKKRKVSSSTEGKILQIRKPTYLQKDNTDPSSLSCSSAITSLTTNCSVDENISIHQSLSDGALCSNDSKLNEKVKSTKSLTVCRKAEGKGAKMKYIPKKKKKGKPQSKKTDGGKLKYVSKKQQKKKQNSLENPTSGKSDTVKSADGAKVKRKYSKKAHTDDEPVVKKKKVDVNKKKGIKKQECNNTDKISSVKIKHTKCPSRKSDSKTVKKKTVRPTKSKLEEAATEVRNNYVPIEDSNFVMVYPVNRQDINVSIDEQNISRQAVSPPSDAQNGSRPDTVILRVPGYQDQTTNGKQVLNRENLGIFKAESDTDCVDDVVSDHESVNQSVLHAGSENDGSQTPVHPVSFAKGQGQNVTTSTMAYPTSIPIQSPVDPKFVQNTPVDLSKRHVSYVSETENITIDRISCPVAMEIREGEGECSVKDKNTQEQYSVIIKKEVEFGTEVVTCISVNGDYETDSH